VHALEDCRTSVPHHIYDLLRCKGFHVVLDGAHAAVRQLPDCSIAGLPDYIPHSYWGKALFNPAML
jgi:hypothetical protein